MTTIINTNELEGKLVKDSGAEGLEYKTLFGSEAKRNLHANLVTVHPGGNTRNHEHEWEQVNYILAGRGVLVINDELTKPLEAGMAIHIPGGEKHCYRNDGLEPLLILGVLGPMPS